MLVYKFMTDLELPIEMQIPMKVQFKEKIFQDIKKSNLMVIAKSSISYYSFMSKLGEGSREKKNGCIAYLEKDSSNRRI